MATGQEMLLNAVIKAFKLEPQVEKVKAAIDSINMAELVATLNELPQLAANIRELRNEVAELRRSIEPGPGNGYRELGPDTFTNVKIVGGSF